MIADILTTLEFGRFKVQDERASQPIAKLIPMSPSIALTMIFVSGLIVLPAFDKWAHQVTEVLVFLLATVVLVMTVLFLCDRWPDYYATPRMPVAITATALGNQ